VQKLAPLVPDPAAIAIVANRRRNIDRFFAVLGVVLATVSLGVLGILLINLGLDGSERLSLEFFQNFPSANPEQAGVKSAWIGTVLLMLVTGCVAIPIGIAAGLYLEEYAKKNWIATVIEINISNLAAVPSIVYGLMALGLFVYVFDFGRSVLSGGLTLGLLVLPIVIVATREAVRAIPQTIREAAYALGATRWQVIWHHLLPYSAGSIATGVIMAMSRAIGESAPLVTIGALTFIAHLPPEPFFTAPAVPFGDPVSGISFDWVMADFAALPIQMFNWVGRPETDFLINAAATGLVIMLVTLCMNAVAITIRYRIQRNIKW